jgi:Flp pilus assembly pilin Flp
MKHKRGQSTLEYILLVMVIVVTLIALAADAGGLRTALVGVFQKAGGRIEKANTLLKK